MTNEIPYMGLSRAEIIENVGNQGKQVALPTKGHPLLLALVKSCLNLKKEERPTFKEILNQLQQRNKGSLPQKKSKMKKMCSYFLDGIFSSIFGS